MISTFFHIFALFCSCFEAALNWSSINWTTWTWPPLQLRPCKRRARTDDGGWQHWLALQKFKTWPYYPMQFLTLQFGFAIWNESTNWRVFKVSMTLSRFKGEYLTDVLPNDPNNFPTLPARRHTRGTQTSCWPTLLQVSSPHVSEVLRMPRSWAETLFNTTSFGVTVNKTSQLNMIWAWNPLESNNQKWASSKLCIFHVVPCPVNLRS